ncbi:hypothetical protein D1AOALGA4SA_2722 [Olavius algarvensis Delta 1 endosymbiont]|nr:hypothetical protein D1AOALGA4SA_2722 [Olavius algarvensis Delta 1 endosymbiont]
MGDSHRFIASAKTEAEAGKQFAIYDSSAPEKQLPICYLLF